MYVGYEVKIMEEKNLGKKGLINQVTKNNSCDKKMRGHHSLESKKLISNKNIGRFLGEKSPRWKGGISNSREYIIILRHNHPFSNKLGYIREHRLIMEEWLRKNEPNHLY